MEVLAASVPFFYNGRTLVFLLLFLPFKFERKLREGQDCLARRTNNQKHDWCWKHDFCLESGLMLKRRCAALIRTSVFETPIWKEHVILFFFPDFFFEQKAAALDVPARWTNGTGRRSAWQRRWRRSCSSSSASRRPGSTPWSSKFAARSAHFLKHFSILLVLKYM